MTSDATDDKAVGGATITLTATPDDGDEFDSWTSVPDDVEILSDNTFTMPNHDVTIGASFKLSSNQLLRMFSTTPTRVISIMLPLSQELSLCLIVTGMVWIKWQSYLIQ